jgi:hypothetical protein
MKKQTKGPVRQASEFPESRMERAFAPEPPLYLVPRLGRRRMRFLIEDVAGEKSLYVGSIDADDVGTIIYAGKDKEWGYMCHVITRNRETFIVQGGLDEVEEAIFGETSK